MSTYDEVINVEVFPIRIISCTCLRWTVACGARWMLGIFLLLPLTAANSSYCAVVAAVLMAGFMTMATLTNRDLKRLSDIVPPRKTSRGRRDRNLRSFADFMSTWMTFLSHLVAVAICARILSATADHVTGGKTRRWIFGYETRALGEPWPDVLGVTVVMVICTMFMCGLEANITFTFMLGVILYSVMLFFIIFAIFNGTFKNMSIPLTIYEVIAAGAPLAYSFDMVLTKEMNGLYSKELLMGYYGYQAFCFGSIAFAYIGMLGGQGINAALPLTSLIESMSPEWMCPILAAVTVAGISLTLTELCPLLFNVLVTLASPEWKVLTRSMTYESEATGSPVLAVFTAGSLAAILAFACPLSHMITLMNGSHLLGIAIQSFHYIIMRCVPTDEQIEAGDVEYKRLGREGTSKTSKPPVKKNKTRPWFFPSALRHTKTLESIKSKVISKEKDDRECLLLDEYSGCPTEEMEQITSPSCSARDIPDVEAGSDVDESEGEISSGDDSTDIDAVVKEYKDTIQVVTSTPVPNVPIPPSVKGSRWAAVGAVIQLVTNVFIAVGVCDEKLRAPMIGVAVPLWLCGAALSWWQPSHEHLISTRCGQSLQGSLSLQAAMLFLTPLMLDSWPAITLFAGAGVVIYARCDRWCGDLAVRQTRHTMESRKMRPGTSSAPLAGARITHVDTVYIAR